MKDLSLSVFGVLAVALGLGLAFHWLYPHVDLTAELAALFVFVALLLRLVLAKGLALLRKPAPPQAGPEPRK